MIVELSQCDFYKCKRLINENGQLDVIAVIEGVNPGRIFVDNTQSPNTGIVWLGNNDGFIFIGNENNSVFNSEVNDWIDNFMVSEAKNVGLDWFEAIGNHSVWDKTIKKIFKHRNLRCWKQKIYSLKMDEFKGGYELHIDPNYTVIRISNDLLKTSANQINNLSFLQTKILTFWNSFDHFLNNGFGYCILFNNEVVSVCFSGFVVGNVHGIDIETIRNHQGKKLAQKIALTYVNECFNNHLVPYWDCMESNKPSVAVAESIGLKNIYNYTGYEFPLV